MNLKVQELFKDAELREQNTTVNKHRKVQGSWKITAAAAAIILGYYVILTLF